MSETTLERLAAIALVHFYPQLASCMDGPWKVANITQKRMAMDATRAILQELREPTEQTQAAGLVAAWNSYEEGSDGASCVMPVWQAMLDHILSEGNGGEQTHG